MAWLLLAIAVVIFPRAARAGALTTEGAVTEVSPPPSLVSGDLESDTEVTVFEEVERELVLDLVVDTAVPGTYGGGVEAPFREDLVAAGTVVTSYFLHADRIDAKDTIVTYQGSITFPGEVVGMAFSPDTLSTSGIPLAAEETSYESGGPHHPDLSDADWVRLHDDLRTVSFYFEQGDLWTPFWAEQDNLRVVVLAGGEDSQGAGSAGCSVHGEGRSPWMLSVLVLLGVIRRTRNC